MTRVLHLALAAALIAPTLSARSDTVSDAKIQAAVQKTLKGRPFKNLQPSVQAGVVTLRGSVDLYSAKVDAKRRVGRLRGIEAVRDEVQIVGPEVTDQNLQARLEKNLQIAGRRIYVQVKQGVVTLGGFGDRRFHLFAIAIIGQTPGVKGFHDVLEPGRMSPLDSMWPSAAPAVGGLSGP